ncbi:SMI1/KNR4 family protein [Taylorella equigenitalis]|uniref:SMI1/KNR4 family protein n=1 Tax=Taylorella equigenitalis TaxID=29575 RepID=UPI000422807A|nr:SMI1/KNR4 family protein [Taylorella equigenitalis]WDU45841.1 hypothetical protein KNO33_04770 [Taylorella equigenitalis]
MVNSARVKEFLDEYNLNLPKEYIQFLSGFENWIRAEIESRNSMLSRDDWAFAGVNFLKNSVNIQGSKERPWFRVLSSYSELLKRNNRQLQTVNGLMIDDNRISNCFAFAEDDGDFMFFDVMNDFKIALFLHEEGKVIYTDENFSDILSSLKIFYRD